MKVSEVQTLVEKALMCSSWKDVATAYVEYRHERDIERDKSSKLKNQIDGLLFNLNSDASTENANKSAEVIPTQRDLVAGEVAKDYALKHLLPANLAEAHKSGLIHIHDLDYSPLFGSYNCQLGNFAKMLREGFKMGNANITQPRSIATAATVLSQMIAQIASSSYGGLNSK